MLGQGTAAKYAHTIDLTHTLTKMSYSWETASLEELVSEAVADMSGNLVHWRSARISSEQEIVIFDIRFLPDKLLVDMPQIARRLLEIRSRSTFLKSKCSLFHVLSV
jgi:hypothetical protein